MGVQIFGVRERIVSEWKAGEVEEYFWLSFRWRGRLVSEWKAGDVEEYFWLTIIFIQDIHMKLYSFMTKKFCFLYLFLKK